MINALKKTMCLLALLVISASGFAQPAPGASIEMADSLYQSGKIYVVVVVLSVIMVGIIGYLIVLDRKIGKLEKEIEKK